MQTNPKENDYDSKYIMGAYKIKRENPLLEALIIEGVEKVIQKPKLFILVERNIVKQLITKRNC
jgi:hypothetical protein